MIYYDGTGGNANLNVTIASNNSGTTTTVTGALGANSWVDPDISGVGTNVTYVGGTINLSNYNVGSWADPTISIGLSTDAQIQYFGGTYASRLLIEPSGGDWRALGVFANANNIQNANSTFNFVLKIYDGAFNASAIAVFLGSNATAGTEGTPDYVLSGPANIHALNPPHASVVDGFRLEFKQDGDATLTTTNMFSSNLWNPVGAVPEPSTSAMLLGGVGSLLLSRRRAR